MTSIKDLLKEYEKADMCKRLNMYLQYRDLREIFLQKERGIIHQELGAYSAQKKTKRNDSCYPNHVVQRSRPIGSRGRLLKVSPRCQ